MQSYGESMYSCFHGIICLDGNNSKMRMNRAQFINILQLIADIINHYSMFNNLHDIDNLP